MMIDKTKLLLFCILLIALLIRLVHVDEGFSQSDEIQDVSNALYNIGVHPSFWIKPERYPHIFYHGPLHAFILSAVSNIILFPFFLYYNAPFPLDVDILSWEKSSGIYLIEVGFRFVSVLYALGTIFFVYKLGRRVHENVGLIAAFLLAVSSWHIYFSYMISPYSGVMFFMTAAVYFFVIGLEETRTRFVYLSAVLCGLTLYMSIISVIIPLFLFAYVMMLGIYKINEKILLNATAIYLGVGLSVYLLMLIIWGPGWLVEYILVKTDLIEGIFYQKHWYPLWDPIHGITDSYKEPSIYLSIFRDYLSPFSVLFCIAGITFSARHILKRRAGGHLLFLCWFFISLLFLQTLNAKTPRYPAVVLPAIVLLSAIGIVELKRFFHGWSNHFVCLALILIIVSEPFLFRFLFEDYVVITEDLGAVYDFRSVADYINKDVLPGDVVYLGVRRFFPWWYIGGNITGENDRVMPYSYWDVPIQLRYSGFPEPEAKYIVVEQLSAEACGTGGGPVWLEAEYGKGRIVLMSVEIDDFRLQTVDNALTLDYSVHPSNGTEYNLEDIRGVIDTKEPIVLIGIDDDIEENLGEVRDILSEFISNGGTVIVLDPKTRYINWLPLEAKVATQVGVCDRTNIIPREGIYFINADNIEGIENVSWTGFFFDYDKRYTEKAFNSPVSIFLHNNYELGKVVRSHELNWPLIRVYKRKQ